MERKPRRKRKELTPLQELERSNKRRIAALVEKGLLDDEDLEDLAGHDPYSQAWGLSILDGDD